LTSFFLAAAGASSDALPFLAGFFLESDLVSFLALRELLRLLSGPGEVQGCSGNHAADDGPRRSMQPSNFEMPTFGLWFRLLLVVIIRVVILFFRIALFRFAPPLSLSVMREGTDTNQKLHMPALSHS
jgi:hypothetical protein